MRLNLISLWLNFRQIFLLSQISSLLRLPSILIVVFFNVKAYLLHSINYFRVCRHFWPSLNRSWFLVQTNSREFTSILVSHYVFKVSNFHRHLFYIQLGRSCFLLPIQFLLLCFFLTHFNVILLLFNGQRRPLVFKIKCLK